jgi:hypothetical protein
MPHRFRPGNGEQQRGNWNTDRKSSSVISKRAQSARETPRRGKRHSISWARLLTCPWQYTSAKVRRIAKAGRPPLNRVCPAGFFMARTVPVSSHALNLVWRRAGP